MGCGIYREELGRKLLHDRERVGKKAQWKDGKKVELVTN